MEKINILDNINFRRNTTADVQAVIYTWRDRIIAEEKSAVNKFYGNVSAPKERLSQREFGELLSRIIDEMSLPSLILESIGLGPIVYSELDEAVVPMEYIDDTSNDETVVKNPDYIKAQLVSDLHDIINEIDAALTDSIADPNTKLLLLDSEVLVDIEQLFYRVNEILNHYYMKTISLDRYNYEISKIQWNHHGR